MSAPDAVDSTGATGNGSVDGGKRWASAVLAGTGVMALVASLVADPAAARSAAGQVWSPFVLVAGLLLVGLVADQDGVFAAVGSRLATVAPGGVALFAGAAAAIAVVTALLNLDTSVVFVTPVLVYTAQSRRIDPAPLLVGCLLLSNAASLLLPGSNLTNLIVLGHFHLSGGQFLARMVLPWLASVAITATVIAVVERRRLAESGRNAVTTADRRVSSALGPLAVAVVTVLVLVLRSPALPVAGVGLVVVTARLVAGRQDLGRVRRVVGAPVLIGLFGVATALGTLGRAWSGPAHLLGHLDTVGTAVVAALASVVVNNLPAAALLAAKVPPHPFALLVGLDLGPNLFVTGSLAWILWWRTSKASGVTPPVTRTVVLGLITVPLAMAAALALLAATGTS
jgi:arsenical pump membrane protein